MARNFSLLKSKRFWVLLTGGIVGVLAILFFQIQRVQEPVFLPGTDYGDSVPPATAIISPKDRTWHNARFSVAIRDSDIGTGLVPFIPGEQGCLYRIEDFGSDRVFGNFRKCGISDVSISVGKDQACSSQGRCRVSAKAIDQAGNESEWKSSLFFIDLESPTVSSVSVDSDSSQGTYVLRGEVADNGKIVSCWVVKDTQIIGSQVSFDSFPCEEGRKCSISTQYLPSSTENHTVRFACRDAAGNVGYGEPLSSLSFINQAPEITLCRVTPSQGNISTVFQFESVAQDSNQDALSYHWEFGDGIVSQDQSPSHRYVVSGTYTPKVTVQDPAGKTDECSTAWAVVREE